MLRVDRITEGIVLDHIRRGHGLKVFEQLGLRGAGYPVALLMNVSSTKMDRKDIIKISGTLNLDLTMLGLLAPDTTVNDIEDGKVTRKVTPGLPEKVVGLIQCKNPRCITSSERQGLSVFTLVDEKAKEYECFYCGERVKV
jgi:aspartate carbamoyltransferase regulatory subunit